MTLLVPALDLWPEFHISFISFSNTGEDATAGKNPALLQFPLVTGTTNSNLTKRRIRHGKSGYKASHKARTHILWCTGNEEVFIGSHALGI